MALTKEITKWILPVLRELGFRKINHYWRLEFEGFYFAITVASGKQSDSQDFLYLDIGVFSTAIDNLYGLSSTFKSSGSEMPGGVILCHFVSSLFQLDEDLNWHEQNGTTKFFSKFEDVSQNFSEISRKLDILLPRFIKTFSSVEKLVECRQKGIGAWAMSTQSKLHGAAGCIILGRYDEAEEFIASAIKIGSAPIMKETAERFRQVIRERRSGQN